MFLSVLVSFAAALSLSLLLTPAVVRVGRHFGLVDLPSSRKVHKRPVPRIGGIAIFLAFLAICGGQILWHALRGRPVLDPQQLVGLLGGALVVFALGFFDDVRGLPPGLKFAVQAGAGAIAWANGIGIHALMLPWIPTFQLGILSLPITIFWFVLVINAINLIDGLDGLAAGVTVFSALVLLIMGLLRHSEFVCLGLASLAGASLGFLRYNFNPAGVFMGDCGSYFLGYMLAALSILGSITTQAGVTILIPIIALGLPLMEAVWSAIRRFLLGHELFRADNDHLHHRLLKLGYTHRRAVLVLYGFALTLGAVSLIMVQASDRVAGLILIGLGLTMVVVIRQLGYIDYLTTDKILGWARDVSAVMGVEPGGRTFLGLQVAVMESTSLEELWEHVTLAAGHLRMDSVDLHLDGAFGDVHLSKDLLTVEGGTGDEAPAPAFLDSARGPAISAPAPACAGASSLLTGVAPGPSSLPTGVAPGSCSSAVDREFDARTTLRISMPVGDREHRLGCLILAKRLDQAPPEYHVLRRMEHLRRATSEALLKIREYPPPARQAPSALLTPRAHEPTRTATTDVEAVVARADAGMRHGIVEPAGSEEWPPVTSSPEPSRRR